MIPSTFQKNPLVAEAGTPAIGNDDKNFELIRQDQRFQQLQVRTFVSAATGSVVKELPNGVNAPDKDYMYCKTDSTANTVTVKPFTGQTINGLTSITLSFQHEFVIVAWDYTTQTWKIIAQGTLSPSFNSINFPATQAPSTNPNTLDDYEEGTWAPSLGGTTTYTTQTGLYTKIGRFVHIQLRLTINIIGTGSASTISGLPFAPNSFGGTVSVAYWANLAILANYVSGIFFGSTIALSGTLTAAASHTIPINAIGSGTDIIITGSYYV